MNSPMQAYTYLLQNSAAKLGEKKKERRMQELRVLKRTTIFFSLEEKTYGEFLREGAKTQLYKNNK